MHGYFLFLLLGSLLGGCAAYTATSGGIAMKDDSRTTSVYFSSGDRSLIASYYRNSTGYRKSSGSVKVSKGNSLPPGAKGEPLAYELERKLSPLPSAYARLRVGEDIVLMNKNTRVLVDVLYGVAH